MKLERFNRNKEEFEFLDSKIVLKPYSPEYKMRVENKMLSLGINYPTRYSEIFDSAKQKEASNRTEEEKTAVSVMFQYTLMCDIFYLAYCIDSIDGERYCEDDLICNFNKLDANDVFNLSIEVDKIYKKKEN